MSNSFYLIVPSAGEDNKTNKFHVQLPKKLILDGQGWTIGLAGIIYPNSWASIGAHEDQIITVHLKDGQIRHLKIPKGSYNSAKHLDASLYHGVIKDIEQRLKDAGYSERTKRHVALETEIIPIKRVKRSDVPLYPASWEKVFI
jgi:hypothetical protein